MFTTNPHQISNKVKHESNFLNNQKKKKKGHQLTYSRQDYYKAKEQNKSNK